MAGSFETSDAHPHFHLKPLRVAVRPGEAFAEAKNLVEDLPAWSLDAADEERHKLVCRRARGWLWGTARVTITCAGPADIPSTTVHVRSVSSGGILSRDRANVLEFMTPFHRRVC